MHVVVMLYMPFVVYTMYKFIGNKVIELRDKPKITSDGLFELFAVTFPLLALIGLISEWNDFPRYGVWRFFQDTVFGNVEDIVERYDFPRFGVWEIQVRRSEATQMYFVKCMFNAWCSKSKIHDWLPSEKLRILIEF